MPRKKGFKMTDEHKAALAEGRRQSRAVREYLEALDAGSKPGRKINPNELKRRIDDLEKRISSEENPAARVKLVQQRLEYERRLEAEQTSSDLDALEKAFVDVAADYTERQGLSYTAWREVGVPAAVLKRAGIRRSTS